MGRRIARSGLVADRLAGWAEIEACGPQVRERAKTIGDSPCLRGGRVLAFL